MDIKKLIVLVLLLVGLVFAGQYACKTWKKINPEPQYIDYTDYGYGKGGKAGKAGPEEPQ